MIPTNRTRSVRKQTSSCWQYSVDNKQSMQLSSYCHFKKEKKRKNHTCSPSRKYFNYKRKSKMFVTLETKILAMRAYCWLMFNLLSTRTPRFFLAQLLLQNSCLNHEIFKFGSTFLLSSLMQTIYWCDIPLQYANK